MMKNRFMFPAVALVLSLLSGCAGQRLEIVPGGNPVTIVIPDQEVKLSLFVPWDKPENAPNLKAAAEFLKKYLQQVAGIEAAIVTEKDRPAGNFILLGPCRATRNHGIQPEKLPPEGYLIKSLPGGIAIAGELTAAGVDRGTLFGIYRFLEEFAGVRWYFPGKLGTVVPEKKKIIIKGPVEIRAQPFFRLRFGGIGGRDLSEWHPVLKYGISQGKIANHTEESWKQLYGKTHPEYFGNGGAALNTPRPCICYSNPGVLNQWLENIKDYLATRNIEPWRACSARPEGMNIPFGPNDAWGKCGCPQCSKLYKPDRNRAGRSSDAIFTLAAQLASGMKKINPDLKLWCLAYQSYLLPPEDPALKLPDNLCITLCLYPTTTASMAQPGRFKENENLVADWFKLLGNNPDRLIIWNYFISPNGYLKVPAEHPHVLADFIRFLKPRALGMFCNGMAWYEEPGYSQTIYMGWIMHQLLWNPDLDVDKAREQFCSDLFGPAAPEMLSFFRLLEDRWEKVRWTRDGTYTVPTKTVFADNFPPDVIAQLKKHLLTARDQSPANTIYRERIDWFVNDVYLPFIERAEYYHQWKNSTVSGQAAEIKAAALKNGVPETGNFSPATALPFYHCDGTTAWAPGAVKAAFDNTNLYLEAVFSRPDNNTFIRKFKKRDTVVNPGDSFAIQLRPKPKAAELLEMNIRADGAIAFTGEQWKPAGAQAAVEKTKETWTARAVIPWKDITENGVVPKALPAQFLHKFDGAAENDSWSPALTFEIDSPRFGKLTFGD